MADNPIFGGIGARPTYLRKPLAEQIAEGNSRLMAMGRHDVHWFEHQGQMVLGWKPEPTALRLASSRP